MSEWLRGLVDHEDKKLVTGDGAQGVDGRLLLWLLGDDEALSCICGGDAVQRAKLKLRIMDENAVQNLRGSGSFLYRIPIVNTGYDLLFDNEPPDRASAEALFNLLGLVAALFITIAMALPAAVDFDELQAVKARWPASMAMCTAKLKRRENLDAIRNQLCTRCLRPWIRPYFVSDQPRIRSRFGSTALDEMQTTSRRR